MAWQAQFWFFGFAAATMLWVNHRPGLTSIGGSRTEYFREVRRQLQRFVFSLRRHASSQLRIRAKWAVATSSTNFMNNRKRCLVVFVYAVAMAWVEAAVVYYLRTMVHRIEPYQLDPFPIIGAMAQVEVAREAATLIMLLTVGLLAGHSWRSRLGYFAMAFGVWDIFYYVFLKAICGWPHSVMDWDILFLIPLPWWGPVLAPVLIALLLIVWGTLASQFEHTPAPVRLKMAALCLGVFGIVLALQVFMADTLAASAHGAEAVRRVLPKSFQWPLFCGALALMSAPVMQLVWHIAPRQPCNSQRGKTMESKNW